MLLIFESAQMTTSMLQAAAARPLAQKGRSDHGTNDSDSLYIVAQKAISEDYNHMFAAASVVLHKYNDVQPCLRVEVSLEITFIYPGPHIPIPRLH